MRKRAKDEDGGSNVTSWFSVEPGRETRSSWDVRHFTNSSMMTGGEKKRKERKGKEEGNDARGSIKGSEIMKKGKSEKRKTNHGCLISTSDTGGKKRGVKYRRQYKTKNTLMFIHLLIIISLLKRSGSWLVVSILSYSSLLLSHPQTLLSIKDQDSQRY